MSLVPKIFQLPTGAALFDFIPREYNIRVLDSDGWEKISDFEMPEFSTVVDIDGVVFIRQSKSVINSGCLKISVPLGKVMVSQS
jgi:hypothetical protein